MEVLLEHKCDPNLSDITRKTALMHACSLGLGSEIDMVLESQACDLLANDMQSNIVLRYCA